ncbi:MULTISPECIES: Hsp20/alpha crystallin family protein [unclassified Ketobacter]|uniref:Hsp20/alpha crystallin family protein n=1 Tax=unclassified Ketobacter TaxID=2639109 RepID=UPI000F225C33|nr:MULTISPECIES: Hsp20/alpha crystallin family protein [unclassified Ketobacter]RLT91252.1 MAG: Hsp20/alpha crystallin family protein [Ketobacter sp. GenoA1]RLT98313.1 MAG: Hsp20/alpha crystallin family protein [Ketobacter sp.]
MDWKKLNPWNWFKHEESGNHAAGQIPVKREAHSAAMPETGDHYLQPMLQLHRDIDRIFEDTLRGFGFPSLGSRLSNIASGESGNAFYASAFRPSLNVSSDDESYQITVEAPGLKQDDFSIEINGDVMTIQGQKQEETENKDRHFYRVERSYGCFQRTLALPEDALTEDVRANLKQGVLTITIPRKELPAGSVKKIEVST